MKHSKRFRYFQPNKLDLKDKTGDCQIRALCKALGVEWKKAFDLSIPLCRELQTYTVFDGNREKTKEAMMRLGFEYHGISNKKGTTRPTVDSFAKDHPEGTYIVSVAHHVVAVVDGCYWDTWDSGYKSLYGYYEKVSNPETKRRNEMKLTEKQIDDLRYAFDLIRSTKADIEETGKNLRIAAKLDKTLSDLQIAIEKGEMK